MKNRRLKLEPILNDDDDDRDGCEEGTGREWRRESTGTGRERNGVETI